MACQHNRITWPRRIEGVDVATCLDCYQPVVITVFTHDTSLHPHRNPNSLLARCWNSLRGKAQKKEKALNATASHD